MTREEFLDTLRMQLQGELSPAQIEGHLHYYREYIAEAVAAGRPESEVLEELGSPVLIARTLIDTADIADEERGGQYTYWSSSERGGYGDLGQEMYQDPGEQEEYGGRKVRTFHVNPLVLKWGIPIALFLILFLILSVVGSVLALVARFFVPILVVVLVIRLFRRE